MKYIITLIIFVLSSITTAEETCPSELENLLRALSERNIQQEFSENIKLGRLGFMSAPAISSNGMNYPGLPMYKELQYLNKATWEFTSVKGEDVLFKCQEAISEKAKSLAEEYNKLMVEYIDKNG
jgi:hypothetical protein